MVSALDLDVAGRVVLLRGDGAQATAQAHRFLAAGARVDVATDDLPTSLRDLAERGLVRLVAPPDVSSYDVVLTCRTPRGERPTRPAGRSGDAPAPRGEVVLVGGGPGDPGLLTVAGVAELAAADVIVYDRLAPLSALAHARPGTELIDVGKIPRGEHTAQRRINAILIERALAGSRVVRFKGGDNFVFGRGGEEALACADAGVPVRIVPGVSSSIAAPALAGIPVTHRSLTQGVTIVSGHVAPGDPRSRLDWAALARGGTTLVVLMGVLHLERITRELRAAGLSDDTPSATIADAGLPSMRVVRAPLAVLAREVERAGLGSPAVTVVGEVAALDLLPGLAAGAVARVGSVRAGAAALT